MTQATRPVGDSLIVYDLGIGIDQIYRFPANDGERYTISLSWAGTGGNPDVDLLIRNPANTAYVAFGATLNLPEVATWTIASGNGNYYVWSNVYDGDVPEWIKIIIKRVAP